MELEPAGNQEPVTAVRFNGGELYAGSGAFLKIYDWRRGELLSSQRFFASSKIHGISPIQDKNCIIWGGRSFSVMNAGNWGPEQLCRDWIVDARVVNRLIYILTAHNEVHEIPIDNKAAARTHRCDERSILYSGSMYITGQQRLVAAGTVFGGVVVWDLDSDKVLYNFVKHEGSIFDIAWSTDGSRLASCSDDRAIFVWDMASGDIVGEGWGHISRIWKLEFVSNSRIVSAAEDCTARVWDFTDQSHTLQSARILTGHQGRNIWGLDVAEDGGVAATGGGDGKIMLWDLKLTDSDNETIEWEMDATFGDRLRSCAIDDNGYILVSTVKGNLFLLDKTQSWQRISAHLEEMALVKAFGSSFVALSPDGSGVFLDYAASVLKEFNLGQSVFDFHMISKRSFVAVLTPPSQKLVVAKIVPDAEIKITSVYNEASSSANSAATSAALSHDGRWICIGTRRGSLALYSTTGDNSNPLKVETRALGSKNDAITSLKFSDDDSHILATSRSSEYGYFSVPDLARLYKNRARRRGSVEGFAQTDDGVLFWGFQNDLFLTWNATLDFEVLSTVCGGSHRSWDVSKICKPDAGSPKTLLFCYVKSPRFVLSKATIQSSQFKRSLLQYGTHGREIRGLEVSPANPSLIAMGSEDTMVSVGWLRGTRIIPAAVLRDGHISGIQCLHWDTSGRRLFTGGGQGELVVWQVNTFGEMVFANEAGRMPSPARSVIHELRVMDFSVLGDNFIAVAFSDSSFMIWDISDISNWKLLLKQKYRECCLLNIDFRLWHNQTWLFITSSDGHLAIYETKGEGMETAELKLRHRLHQSGIRASQILEDDDGALIYYSGGDDNAIRATKVDYVSGEIVTSSIFESKHAHSSSVTALALSEDHSQLISTSADQKIKVWSANGEQLGGLISDVSDTGVLIKQGEQVITGGIGVSFYHLKYRNN